VTGHGIPEALLGDIREATREFFHLPSEEKVKYANQTDGGEFQSSITKATASTAWTPRSRS